MLKIPGEPASGDAISDCSARLYESPCVPQRVLVAQDQASVYMRPHTPEGERPRWNVWDATCGKGRRVELEPWAMRAMRGMGVLSPQAAAEDPKSPSEGAM